MAGTRIWLVFILNLFMLSKGVEVGSTNPRLSGDPPALSGESSQNASTCDVPPVTYGDTATLTCDFKRLVSRNETVQAIFYGATDNDTQSVILDCYTKTSGENTCDVLDTYQLQGSVTRFAVITFKAVEARRGRYRCLILSADPNTFQTCVFELGKTNVGSNEDISQDSIIGMIIGIICAIVIIMIIGACLIWRKCNNRRGLQPASDRNQFPELRCCSSSDSLKAAAENQKDSTQRDREQTALLGETIVTEEQRQSSGSRKDSGFHSNILKCTTGCNGPDDVDSNQPTSGSLTSTPVNLSSVQKILEPFINLLDKFRTNIQTQTPPTPAKAVPESDYTIEFNLEEITNENPCLKQVASPSAERRPSSPKVYRHAARDSAWTTLPPSPTDWPPLDNLHEQKKWIENNLGPFVGCKDFPRNTDEANRQLGDLLKVQESIQCRIADLGNQDSGFCTPDLNTLKEAVISKLEWADKLATTRRQALEALVKTLVRMEHDVQNARHKMDSVKGDHRSS